jgi:hypothetical protein
MVYHLQVAGFEGQDVEVDTGSVWSGPRLLVNGEPAPKGPKLGSMLLRRTDGREVIATWKPSFLGLDTPSLVVDGAPVQVAEPLPWYEWAWSALPIALILVGGFLGAMAGFVATTINIRIFRAQSVPVLRWGLTLFVSVGAVIFYVVVASLVFSLVQP